MVDASLLLHKQLSAKLLSCSDHYLEVLKASISLVLLTISQLSFFCPEDEKGDMTSRVANASTKLKENLKGWITDGAVIGGSVFGQTVNVRFWKAEQELKV